MSYVTECYLTYTVVRENFGVKNISDHVVVSEN